MAEPKVTRKFETGDVYLTKGVDVLTKKNDKYRGEVMKSLARYLQGDWGDLDDEDKLANEQALKYEERLLGRYNIEPRPIYIITEWDRSATTILFPEEY